MAAVVVALGVVALVVVVTRINMQCGHKITLKSGDVVPCGKCPACKANDRLEWVFRLKQEYLSANQSIFVTLTYDDEHIPLDLSVNKRDIQLFHKRLRKHFPSKDLRFYLVSEYGDHTFRPHYHGLYFFKGSYDLDFIYKVFIDSWQQGFIKFGEVEEGSIVYCTKYCLKHNKEPKGLKPTFRLMSKMNGGVGFNYLQLMADYHLQNDQFKFVSYGGQTCRMPRYYRSKLGRVLDPSRIYSEMRDQSFHDFTKQYQRYLRSHGKTDSESTRRDFNDYVRSSILKRDDLILLHTKKQSF